MTLEIGICKISVLEVHVTNGIDEPTFNILSKEELSENREADGDGDKSEQCEDQ